MYAGSGAGTVYGPSYGRGAVVGCGVHHERGEVFFTLNGKHLGVACRNVSGLFYAMIGMHAVGESVVLNLGSRPFRFNLDSYVEEEHRKAEEQFAAIDLSIGAVNELVAEHLSHNGYASTYAAFAQANATALTGALAANAAVGTLADRQRTVPANARTGSPLAPLTRAGACSVRQASAMLCWPDAPRMRCSCCATRFRTRCVRHRATRTRDRSSCAKRSTLSSSVRRSTRSMPLRTPALA